jgi:hypothetical protein
MTKKLPSPADLIEAFGGSAKVAEILSEKTGEEISRIAVVNWKRRGIPRGRVADLALAKNRTITTLGDLHPRNWTTLFPELLEQKKVQKQL